MMNGSLIIEGALALAALVVLGAYHLSFFRQLRRDPTSTTLGMAHRTRRAWVATVMTERRDVLAVQTLRNWMMAATFLASAAIIVGLGLLNLALTSDRLARIGSLINLLGADHPTLWLGKELALAAVFFFAFFNFALAIRYFNHVAFTVNVPPDADGGASAERVARVLNRAATHYNLGMRGYFLSAPFALWLFGPVWLLVGSVVVTLILRWQDHII